MDTGVGCWSGEGISWAPLPGLSLQALVQETEAQSKKLAGMEAGAACLTQDNGGPPSLVGSAKERLASVLQQVSKRREVLEEAHQEAKQVSHTETHTPRAVEDRGGGVVRRVQGGLVQCFSGLPVQRVLAAAPQVVGWG